MSSAFLCDRCGKLQPGLSHCRASLIDGGGNVTDPIKYSFEYCMRCAFDVKAFFNNEGKRVY